MKITRLKVINQIKIKYISRITVAVMTNRVRIGLRWKVRSASDRVVHYIDGLLISVKPNVIYERIYVKTLDTP